MSSHVDQVKTLRRFVHEVLETLRTYFDEFREGQQLRARELHEFATQVVSELRRLEKSIDVPIWTWPEDYSSVRRQLREVMAETETIWRHIVKAGDGNAVSRSAATVQFQECMLKLYEVLDELKTPDYSMSGLPISHWAIKWSLKDEVDSDYIPSEETSDPDDPIAGPIRVYIDSDAYTTEEKGEILSLLSELYYLDEGDRLEIDNMGTAEPVGAVALSPNGGDR